MIIELLLEDREDRKKEAGAKEEERKLKESVENEQRLIEYAKARGKKVPTNGIYSSRELQDVPIKTGGELIPFGLSEKEKAILKEYYES